MICVDDVRGEHPPGEVDDVVFDGLQGLRAEPAADEAERAEQGQEQRRQRQRLPERGLRGVREDVVVPGLAQGADDHPAQRPRAGVLPGRWRRCAGRCGSSPRQDEPSSAVRPARRVAGRAPMPARYPERWPRSGAQPSWWSPACRPLRAIRPMPSRQGDVCRRPAGSSLSAFPSARCRTPRAAACLAAQRAGPLPGRRPAGLPGRRHPRRRQDDLRAAGGRRAAGRPGDRRDDRGDAHRAPQAAVGGRGRRRSGIAIDPDFRNSTGGTSSDYRASRSPTPVSPRTRCCTGPAPRTGAPWWCWTRCTTPATRGAGATRSGRRSNRPSAG